MNFTALDRYMDEIIAKKNVPGTAIAVYQRGKLLHTYAAGLADVENRIPFSTHTLVNLYSATKISTATAGMILIERGILDPEGKLSDFYPEFAHMKIKNEDGSLSDAQNPILIRHLFTMTAGFSYNADTAGIRALKAETPAPATDQVIRALADEPLLFEPGTRFKYSLCHDVLAGVIEKASGMRFSAFLKKEIFDPLGMKNTGFKLTDEQMSRFAPEHHGYDSRTGKAKSVVRRPGVDMGMGENYESGGAGLISCADDYGKLAATLAYGGLSPDGVRILQPETVDLMRTCTLCPQALEDFAEMGGWSKAGYGYGMGVRTLIDRDRNHSLSEVGEFGWDGALGCYLVADPATGIGIFCAQEEGGSMWWTFHGMIRNLAIAGVIGGEEYSG